MLIYYMPKRTHKRRRARHMRHRTCRQASACSPSRTRTARRRTGGELTDAQKENRASLAASLSKPTEERLKIALESVCKNSNQCLAIGQYNSMINTYFKNFRDFAMIDPSATSILSKGQNGVVIDYKFVNGGYSAHALMKASLKRDADNLYYEWYVGTYFVNRITKLFPAFLETYGMYLDKYSIAQHLNPNGTMKSSFNVATANRIIERMTPASTPLAWGKSCVQNETFRILIQYFDKCNTLYNMTKTAGFKSDVYSALFQLYFPLSVLGKFFTHYDMHSENVLVYKPFEGKKYITFVYHLADGRTVTFPCEYIMKIIDYGRSYFNTQWFKDEPNPTNTSLVVNALCQAPECSIPGYPDSACGSYNGYNVIQGSTVINNFDFYNIDPVRPNISHDLRSFFNVKSDYDDLAINGLPLNVFFIHKYGTPEKDSPYIEDPDPSHTQYGYTVTNVQSVIQLFADKADMLALTGGKYSTPDWENMGTLHIYADGTTECTFTPADVAAPMPATTSATTSAAYVSPSTPVAAAAPISVRASPAPTSARASPAKLPTTSPVKPSTPSPPDGARMFARFRKRQTQNNIRT